MAKHILLQGCYQLAWMFLILYGAPRWLDRYRDPSICHYYSNPANSGLGLSACCQEGLNCLQTQGGMYLPGACRCVDNDPAARSQGSPLSALRRCSTAPSATLDAPSATRFARQVQSSVRAMTWCTARMTD